MRFLVFLNNWKYEIFNLRHPLKVKYLNKFFLTFYQSNLYIKFLLVVKFNFSHYNIINRFLEVEHTQSAGDSMHACIENYAKTKEVFSQIQWDELMRAACVKHPYEVNHIHTDNIKDFNALASEFIWKNVPILKVREIVFDPSDSGLIKCKIDFDAEAEPACVFKKKQDFNNIFQTFTLKTVRKERISLKEKKKQDVQLMLRKRWIPQKYRNFYEEILNI